MNPFVPYQDLTALHRPHKDLYTEAIQEVTQSGQFSGGPFVEKFEADFAAYSSRRYAIGVGSGTEALWLSLLACGIGPGDEVITVPNTFVATVEAIALCGARPVFVDVEADSFNLDPNLLEAAITPRTKAIVPVHLFGQMARMEDILRIAKHYKLRIIEDASQAHGSSRFGCAAGTWGDLGCFSFYPGKNLGAFGEAGGIITDDSALNEKLRKLRAHGSSTSGQHSSFGWNARMDGLQAAVLSIKLNLLNDWNQRRAKIAERFLSQLEALPQLTLPKVVAGNLHCFHIFAIQAENRDQLLESLRTHNIDCRVHYPTPIHLQEAWKALGYQEGDFPVAESICSQLISLPIHPELPDAQQEQIIQTLHHLLESRLAA